MKTNAFPLGKLIDAITDNREKQRKLNDQLKALKEEYEALEETIKQRLDTEGMDKATGKKATVSISKVIVANVVDWDKFYALIKRKGYFHLLQRRVSDPAFRELLEMNGEAFMEKHGVEPFTKVNLNLRNL